MNINIKYCLIAMMALVASATAGAQEYDDIYYNPSKEKKAKTTKTKTTAPVQVTEYAPAGSYSGNWNMTNTRDIDEYNRRYQVVDSVNADTTIVDDNFEYTRRIERFHNPDVVVETGNDDFVDWYYTQSQPQTTSVVNVYVNNDPWLWSYPYNYSYWYRPYGWYTGFWGPSWSWSWGYDPWFSWGYGPGWGWGWTPGPSWGWHPGPGRPVAGNWRPTSPGASRPHGVATHANGGRGYYSHASNSRPGNMGRPSASSSAGRVSTSAWMRPGNAGRPSHANNSSAGVNTRPGASGRPSGYSSSSSSSSSRNSYNSSSSRSNYNSSSSSSRSSYNSSSSGSHRGGAGSSYGGGRGGSSHGGGRGGRR